MTEKKLVIYSGAQMDANYTDQVIRAYKGNPLIEALPPIKSEEEIRNALKIDQEQFFNADERELEKHYRLECVNCLKNYFFVPYRRDVELGQAVQSTIRSSYIGRNPLQPTFVRLLREENVLSPKTTQKYGRNVAVQGFALIGVSGVGKSTSLSRTLLTYPQVINHSRYGDQKFLFTQVVWLKLDCPSSRGSVRSLCFNFFLSIDAILGSNYYLKYTNNGRATAEAMLPQMARVAVMHGLGLLVVDEIQNLVGAPDDMLKFFVQLENTIGVPVVMVGTPQASKLFAAEFRKARRSIGPENLSWDRFQLDERWERLLKNLFKYDWTKNGIETEEVIKTIYQRTMGIPDLAVKLFIGSQKRAIENGVEKITSEVVMSVADNMFKRINAGLKALANGQLNHKQIEDLVLIEDEKNPYELTEENKIQYLESLKRQEKEKNDQEKTDLEDLEAPFSESNTIRILEKEVSGKETVSEASPRAKRSKQSQISKVIEVCLKKKESPLKHMEEMGLLSKKGELKF